MKPQKAKITLAADQKVYQVRRSENEKDEDGNVTEKIVMYDTYAASSVNFTAKAIWQCPEPGCWTAKK